MDCKICGKYINEDTTNPNIHYSEPSAVCWRCESKAAAPVGAWLQRPDGSYYQKQ